MKLINRIVVRIAERAVGLVHRRFDLTRGLVWHVNVSANRPRRFVDGSLSEKLALLSIGFGQLDDVRPVIDIVLTREMLDLFIQGAISVREQQDAQYNIMEKG
jgi:hypothetical protein